MTDPRILSDTSLAGMLRAVADEADARSLDLTSAVRRQGWESTVLETPDWIIRFPRADDAPAFRTELEILDRIRGRLPVRTPEVRWIGQRTRCMAYPKLIGTSFVPSQWPDGSSGDRDRLAGSLADLVEAWVAVVRTHGIGTLDLPAFEDAPYASELRRMASRVPGALRPGLESLIDLYGEVYEHHRSEAGTAILHGDFHLGNMVLDGPCGAVVGLWDFSCVVHGPLVWDLHYLAGELGDPLADHAHPGVGPHLDLLDRVSRRLSRAHGRSSTVPLLADLMVCAESIGDGGEPELARWTPWLVAIHGSDGERRR